MYLTLFFLYNVKSLIALTQIYSQYQDTLNLVLILCNNFTLFYYYLYLVIYPPLVLNLYFSPN
jgi:hypothetical protein